jgi:hypothetical protein
MSEINLAVQTAVKQWNQQVLRAAKLLNDLSDQDLEKQVSPGKNRGKYLVGHLIAIHDLMAELLGVGARNYAELSAIYVQNPDGAILPEPTISELRIIWQDVHQRLQDVIPILTIADWFSKHEAVVADDFLKDPTRNKYSILLSRTQHLSYHMGQLRLLIN